MRLSDYDMTRTWSPYQEAIFATNPGKESIIIEACAGSGKTSTVVELANRTKACRGIAIAFSKRVATELSERMPRHFDCTTLNSLGHKAWGAKLHKKPTLSKEKLYDEARRINIPQELIGDVVALVRMARVNGLVVSSMLEHAQGTPPIEDTPDTWEEIADQYDLEFSLDILPYARELLQASIQSAFKGVIDFDDQIYMSALFGGIFAQYDIVAVDEVQDLSALQRIMVAKLCSCRTRVIAVGDSHQSIFGFRGADNNSMTRFRDKFNLKELPLTISYRCPKAVVREAQQFVHHIESADEAPEGKVETIHTFDLTKFEPGSVVLCRNVAPLTEVAWKLIRAGISIQFLGRQLGKGLERLVKKLAKERLPIDVFLHNLTVWSKREIERKPKAEAAIQDKVDTLIALSQECAHTEALLRKIEQVFADKPGRITLATMHTSKGLEWETVYILNRDLVPSKYATQEWQLQQEDNLMYVAVTRAKQNLFYINSKDII